MVSEKVHIVALLTTLEMRATIRFQTYARQYESFRRYPLCEDEQDRELQLSIAYLYHTSLGILEERLETLSTYIEDVKGVLETLEDTSVEGHPQEVRENLQIESIEQIAELNRELAQIDRGIKAAHRQEKKLMAD